MSSVCLPEIDIMMTYTSHQNLTVFMEISIIYRLRGATGSLKVRAKNGKQIAW